MRDIFEYPFDHVKIFRSRGRIRSTLEPIAQRSIKIYILSGSTVAELKDLIGLFLLNFGVNAQIEVGDYNTYFEDALFGEKIDAFSPDWVYVHTSIRNLSAFPKLTDDGSKFAALVDHEVSRIRQVVAALTSRSLRVVVNNIDKPALRGVGNLSAYHPTGTLHFVNRLNEAIYDIVRGTDGVFLNDIDYLSAVVGLDRWHDWNYWNAFKYAVSPYALPWVAASVASIISAAEGAGKKALVCDLDNTLWGGVIGDDGKEGIVLGPDTAKGEAYQAVQEYVRALKDRGIALAVNSKNEPELAKTGFDHEHSLLSFEDFAAFEANWSPKSSNIGLIESQLNLSADSFAYIDDNAAEISEVAMHRPEVFGLRCMKTPIELIVQLDRLGIFEAVSLSAEDLNRSTYYQDNLKRESLRNQVGSIEDYLRSLELKARIGVIGPLIKDRAVQLINKTNQFNPTTQRIDMQELEQRLNSGMDIALYAGLKDRFGDNGIVSVLLARTDGKAADIDTWVMSCRVFNRELELALLDRFVARCQELGVEDINAIYRPTPKNGYVASLYEKLGFQCIFKDENESRYHLNIRELWVELNKLIEIENESN